MFAITILSRSISADYSTGWDLEDFAIRRRIYDRAASIIPRNVIIAVARGARACLSSAQFSRYTCASVISKSRLRWILGGNGGKDRSKRVDFLLPNRTKEKERKGICVRVNWSVAQGYAWEPFESFLPGPCDFEEEKGEGSHPVKSWKFAQQLVYKHNFTVRFGRFIGLDRVKFVWKKKMILEKSLMRFKRW